VQLGIELFDALEVNVGEALGGQLSLFDPARQSNDGGESDVSVVRRQRAGIGFATQESLAAWAAFHAWQHGVPECRRCEIGIKSYLARSGASLVEGCHCFSPAARGNVSLALGQFHLHELLGFSERGRRYFRSNRRAHPKCRRSARWQI